MAKTIQTFEDLEVWQLARALAKDLYWESQTGTLSKDFELRNAINKTSGSVMDNIAEGFERGGNKEFIQFLAFARGSAGELRSQIIRAGDRQHFDQPKLETYLAQLQTISKQLSGFSKYLGGSDYRGHKFVREDSTLYGDLNLES